MCESPRPQAGQTKRRLAGRMLLCGALVIAGIAGTAGVADAAPDDGYRTNLLFVSTRAVTDSDNPAKAFNGERGPVSYGECTVVYDHPPRTDKWDSLYEILVPDGEREVESVARLTENELHDRLGDDSVADIVVFVHGYAYGFGRGCRRVSDLQVVLGDATRTVLYSWPSNGNPASYRSDERDMAWSVPALSDFLGETIRRYGAGRVKLVAHSLGSRGAIAALAGLEDETDEGDRIQDVVLIAPDVDASVFADGVDMLRRRANRVTVYVSEDDVPLGWSARINGEKRLGQGGKNRRLFEGVETIDITGIERYHPMGHEYHYFNPVVVSDLVELLAEGREAQDRSRTAARAAGALTYWILEAP